MKLIGLAISCALTVSACGGGSNSSPTPAPLSNKEKIAALEAAGRIPVLDRSLPLTGTDSNGDGVRDDVGAYMAAKYPSEPQWAAAVQYAKLMQAVMLIEPTDTGAVETLNERLSRAVHCIFLRFPAGAAPSPDSVAHELTAISINTKPRLLAYLQFNKALDGTSWELPRGDTCE